MSQRKLQKPNTQGREMTNNKQQTAVEKAKELVESFLSFSSNEATTEDGFIYSERMRVWNAKQCALIAVDEILNIVVGIYDYDSQVLYPYWNEVKQEIEKL
jgi:hypothetical protein